VHAGSHTLRLVFFIGLLVLLITFGLGEAAPEANTAQTARPTLAITDMQPLSISGRGFKANERVVVSIGPRRRAVTADGRGRFAVRFARVSCASGTVRAVGSKGSRAAAHFPKTLCIEP
jgi:hypothetical protein